MCRILMAVPVGAAAGALTGWVAVPDRVLEGALVGAVVEFGFGVVALALKEWEAVAPMVASLQRVPLAGGAGQSTLLHVRPAWAPAARLAAAIPVLGGGTAAPDRILTAA